MADLKQAIIDRGLLRDGKMLSKSGTPFTWMFDFRRLLLEPEFIHDVAGIFWDRMAQYMPFQIAGLEMAGVPLVTAIQLVGRERGIAVNGLIVRAKAKKNGTQKLVEGDPLPGVPVVAIDDSANTFGSFAHIRAAAESVKISVERTWCILSFHGGPPDHWPGVQHHQIFIAADFGLKPQGHQRLWTWREIWRFEPPRPNLYYAVSKSQAVLADGSVYFGSDDGAFWCIDQASGMVRWKLDAGIKGGKGIWSTAALYEDAVIFGGYDGCLYRVRRADGALVWRHRVCDWIGSSPTICQERIWIGIEHRDKSAPGGMAVFDPSNGALLHEIPLRAMQHGSGETDGERVYFGTNDGRVICCDGDNLMVRWEHDAGGAVKYPPAIGDGFVVFGSFDGSVRALDAETGALVHRVDTGDLVYATPLIHDGWAYLGSSDHSFVALDLVGGRHKRIDLGEKIHCSPALINGEIVVGTSAGVLLGLEPRTLRLCSRAQLPARITERVGFSDGVYFIKTYDNVLRAMVQADPAAADMGTVVRSGVA
jgi:outer membrane protein assembly factor BamB